MNGHSMTERSAVISSPDDSPSLLAAKLQQGRFVVTAEVSPPRGCDTTDFLARARHIAPLVDAVNVTDNQGATMRLSPLAAAVLCRQVGIEPIMQLTTRDRNRLALQSDLLGAAALGIHNILALTGDHGSCGDQPASRQVFDLDSVQLLQVMTQLSAGTDLAGNRLHGAPRFFAGAAANPGAVPLEISLIKLRKKVAAGAHFFQTQAVFEPERLATFHGAVAPLGVSIVVGILLLRSAAMARRITERVPGLKVPQPLIDEMEQSADPVATGIQIARRLIIACRPYCHGIHLMTMGREELIPAILNDLQR
jgi:5,10-methylenetetrahydrofolate reductase